MFQCYKKDDHIIWATKLAYDVIYSTQGYKPLEFAKAESKLKNDAESKAGDADGTAGGSPGDSGKAKTTKRSRKSE